MAVTAYTEATFRAYLYSQLSSTLGATIGWSSADDAAFTMMVDDTLLVLDTADIATLTTSGALQQLRAVGRYMLWRAAIQWTVTQFDVTTGGSSFKRSQIVQHLQALLRFAYDDALAAGVPPEDLPPAPGSVAMPPATIHPLSYDDAYSQPSSLYGVPGDAP